MLVSRFLRIFALFFHYFVSSSCSSCSSCEQLFMSLFLCLFVSFITIIIRLLLWSVYACVIITFTICVLTLSSFVNHVYSKHLFLLHQQCHCQHLIQHSIESLKLQFLSVRFVCIKRQAQWWDNPSPIHWIAFLHWFRVLCFDE